MQEGKQRVYAAHLQVLENVFYRTAYLQAKKLLAGLDVPLNLTGHWLDNFNTILIKHIEHVSNPQTYSMTNIRLFRAQIHRKSG